MLYNITMRKNINKVVSENYGKVSISTVLIVATLVATGGFYGGINKTQAAALTKVQSVLSNSAPSASSSLTLYFVTPTGVSSTKDLTLTVQLVSSTNAFTLPPTYIYSDVDMATSSDATCNATFTELAIGSSTSTSQWKFATSSDSKITMTYTGVGGSANQIPANTCVRLNLGATATASGTGVAFSNPGKSAGTGVADTYSVTIGGTISDSGNGMVAIIEGVTVSATINSTLSFSMTGVTAGSCTGDSSSTPGTAVDTSAASNTIPFGTVTTNLFYIGCHRLSVSTNAASGFYTSIEENKPMKAVSSTIVDTTCDNSCDHASSTSWSTETNNGLGYSCENISSSGLCNNSSTVTLGGVKDYRNIACTGGTGYDFCNTALDTKQVFMATSGPVSAKDVRVHYKLSVPGTQEAGSYSNTVTYIATPSF